MERPSGVSSASEDSWAASARSATDTPETGRTRRLAVADGDRAGLVEQQRVHVARRLDGAPGHGEHVALDEPVHAGDADRGQQRPDGGRDQRDEQRDQEDEVCGAPE